MNNENIIIYEDPLLGIFTLQDLINYLEKLIEENNQNLEILASLIQDTELDESDKTTILNKYDLEGGLKFILDLLSDRL